MKKYGMMVMIAALVLVLAACSGNNENAVSNAPTPAPTPAPVEEAADVAVPEEAVEEAVEVAGEEAGEVAYNVVLTASGENGLKIVRIVRDAAKLDLMAAKDLVNNVPSVVATQLTQAEANALKAEIEAEGGTVDVLEVPLEVSSSDGVTLMLTANGESALDTVKAIQEATGLGLADAKALVDNVPSVIAEDISIGEAEVLKEIIAKSGAVLEIQE